MSVRLGSASIDPGLHCASIERPRTAASASFALCFIRAVAIVPRLSPSVSKQRDATLTSDGLANRLWFFSFCGLCHQLFTTSHRIPQAIMQVSQAVHERPEDKTAICACG